MISSALARASRVFARFHLWAAVVVTLAWAGIGDGWSKELQGRFTYAAMLGRKRRIVRNAFSKVLRRNLGRSASTDLWLAHTAWRLGCFKLMLLIAHRVETSFEGSAESVIAAREFKFAAGILDGSLEATLSDSIAQISGSIRRSEPLILVPLSGRFTNLFQLWKQQVEKHGEHPLVVLALDGAAKGLASQQPDAAVIDLSTYFGFDSAGVIEDYSKRHLWVLRVLLLRQLLSRGYDVISLDLDAILVGDLEPLLQQLPAAGMVVQRDYSIPIDVARELGFILCCGFMVIRSNPSTRKFFDRYCTQVLVELDDQTALNHLIAAEGIQSKKSTPTYLSFQCGGVSWVCPDPTLVSRDADRGLVLRHFQQTNQSIAELRRRLGVALEDSSKYPVQTAETDD